jgi:hypothetical protein
MNELSEIQDWYFSNCDKDWEHQYGIKIETLDNPGWTINIDLDETDLENKTFTQIEKGLDKNAIKKDEMDWYTCKVENNKFIGCCGPLHLETLLKIFFNWKNKIALNS